MDLKSLLNFFSSFKNSELTYPFDDKTPVFKVEGKMFGLIGEQDGKIRVNLKGDPDDNIHLRSIFDFIEPGYHMNKTHWNSIYIDGNQDDELIMRLIEESYNLVVSKLPKKVRESINNRIT